MSILRSNKQKYAYESRLFGSIVVLPCMKHLKLFFCTTRTDFPRNIQFLSLNVKLTFYLLSPLSFINYYIY